MIIQVYEIQRLYEARMLKRLNVDHIGTVVEDVEDYKNAEVQTTVEYVNSSGMVSCLIPLFSNEEKVLDALAFYRPQVVHFCDMLHQGGEISQDADRYLRLQKRAKQELPFLKVMRTIPVGVKKIANQIPTFEIMKMFEADSDFFLIDTVLDARKQPGGNSIGITGKTCDWDKAAEVVKRANIPVILAGGLGPDNVAEAIARVKPYGVDSCTKTNALDEEGNVIRYRKDMDKVRKFIDNVRQNNVKPSFKRIDIA